MPMSARERNKNMPKKRKKEKKIQSEQCLTNEVDIIASMLYDLGTPLTKHIEEEETARTEEPEKRK